MVNVGGGSAVSPSTWQQVKSNITAHIAYFIHVPSRLASSSQPLPSKSIFGSADSLDRGNRISHGAEESRSSAGDFRRSPRLSRNINHFASTLTSHSSAT